MLTALQKAARNGCRIVSINPLPETGTNRFQAPAGNRRSTRKRHTLAELWLPVRINGDVALFKAFSKKCLKPKSATPAAFSTRVHPRTHERLRRVHRRFARRKLGRTGRIQRHFARADAQAAEIAMNSKRTIACWAMGLTQHKNAVGNIQEIVNMLLLRGSIGRPGAGVCPVRGHSNVQGDRTMGIWERPAPGFLDALGREFGFEPPRHHGLDVVEAIKSMHDGSAKVFFAMGGNFLSATPDTTYTAEALRRCRLTVQVSTKLNRGHLITGEQALILPCLGRTERDVQTGGEQFVSVENSMGVVHASRGSLQPASKHLLSEPTIVARLATATLNGRSTIDWNGLVADYDRIRDRIEKVIDGFDDYNRRVREPGGFYLPNSARERQWKTATGKANFTVHAVPHHNLKPDEFMMMTMRSHDQYNTTIYGLDDRYRGIYNERRVVLLNREDMQEFGLAAGQVVDLISHFQGQQREAKRFIVVEYSIPRRSAATYFPEANVLVPVGSVAEKSNTPTSKSVVITVRPSQDSPIET
jgi:molybdopterin-dependent oxidoreductase alpha subunit